MGAGGGTGMAGEAGQAAATAEQLRGALVGKLADQGLVPTGRVEAAFRAVPRHLFLPGVPLEKAYADSPVVTKRDSGGGIISTASQPAMMATMLEQLQTEPGQRVLEIGAGTGYNAGLLGVLTGDGGQVTTIDVDEDIVAGARDGLTAAGIGNVRAVLGDGALGWADGAPYDRVIATVGVWDLPPAWLEQLTPEGRLVVPLRLRGGVSRSVAFERDGGCWQSRDSAMCGFIPLRGIADDARHKIPLAPDGSVELITHQDQVVDAGALAGVLNRERTELWTGVPLAGWESVGSLHLWLACVLANSLSLMPVRSSAAERGVVQPQSGFGSMAVTDGGDLAYLTGRSAGKVHGQRQQEAGVIGHGTGGERLASAVAEQIHSWDRDYRSHPIQIAIQPAGAPGEPLTGQFVFGRPHGQLAISWT